MYFLKHLIFFSIQGTNALKRLILTAFLGLLAWPALATFEIRDPASEVYQETPQEAEQEAQRQGYTACIDFLIYRDEHPDRYRDGLDWVAQAVGAGNEASATTEQALREYCIDHPKDSLQKAAGVIGSANPG